MKKNFIKKIILGVLISSLCLYCCFINVNATQLDDYSPTNGTQTLPLKTWEDITEPNDLLGVTLLFNDNPKSVGLPFTAEQGAFLQISYSYNAEEYELESFPKIWGLNTSTQILTYQNVGSSMILRIEEEYEGVDDPITIFTETRGYEGRLLKSGGNYENPNEPLNPFYYNMWTQGPRLISFPLDQRDPEAIQLELIVTGNNWNSDYSNAWQAMFAFLRRNTTIIYSSNMATDLLSLNEIEAYEEGYALGYDVGYNRGYQDGEASSGNDSYRFKFLTAIFNGVSDLLAIEIFPNVQLGYFVFVPLALGITGMIFWFWRKD